ncbi:MAG: Clp protease N-terminal domain-containing protein, partial [Pseudomonadota bacterium]
MATLSDELEKTLHRTIALSRTFKHEYVTLEHLLYSLCDDKDAGNVLKSCHADLEMLRQDLHSYLENELAKTNDESFEEPRSTAAFQRVLQRAAVHVQSSGKQLIT